MASNISRPDPMITTTSEPPERVHISVLTYQSRSDLERLPRLPDGGLDIQFPRIHPVTAPIVQLSSRLDEPSTPGRPAPIYLLDSTKPSGARRRFGEFVAPCPTFLLAAACFPWEKLVMKP